MFKPQSWLVDLRESIPPKAKEKLVYDILPELQEMAPRPAGSVPGGQGKMVALGMALMIGSTLIILDKPLQGLALAQRYAETLFRLRSFDLDVTLLLTEANLPLLKNLADRA